MNRVSRIILVVAAVFLLAGCAKTYKDIKLTSFKLVSVSLRGLAGVDVLVDVGVDNPVAGFEVSDMTGTVKMDGRPCLNISSDNLMVQGKVSEVYRIPLVGELDGDFNPFLLLTLVKNMDPSRFSVDFSARIKLGGGLGKVIEKKDLPLEDLMQTGKNLMQK